MASNVAVVAAESSNGNLQLLEPANSQPTDFSLISHLSPATYVWITGVVFEHAEVAFCSYGSDPVAVSFALRLNGALIKQ